MLKMYFKMFKAVKKTGTDKITETNCPLKAFQFLMKSKNLNDFVTFENNNMKASKEDISYDYGFYLPNMKDGTLKMFEKFMSRMYLDEVFEPLKLAKIQ
jgi:hypothetical protein